EGKPLDNASLAQHPATVLNFFAPNCGFCKKQIPRLEVVRKKYVDKGVRFVNVSQKMGKPYDTDKVKSILSGLGFEGEIAINHDNSVGKKFNVSGFPTMVILGKDGKIAAVNVGNVADLETRVPKQLDAMIAGKPIPVDVATKPKSAAAKKPRQRPAMAL
ncbi:MAG: TlpA family protein disulfide reductase, partial [Chloroflexi bacterium]|nr:TlpA family protein disulfide reductase [Chloroflexota bacterium]